MRRSLLDDLIDDLRDRIHAEAIQYLKREAHFTITTKPYLCIELWMGDDAETIKRFRLRRESVDSLIEFAAEIEDDAALADRLEQWVHYLRKRAKKREGATARTRKQRPAEANANKV